MEKRYIVEYNPLRDKSTGIASKDYGTSDYKQKQTYHYSGYLFKGEDYDE